jgi:hypothetical protein
VTPRWYAHRSKSRDTNSVPWSTRIVAGNPASRPTLSRTSTTSAPRKVKRGSTAGRSVRRHAQLAPGGELVMHEVHRPGLVPILLPGAPALAPSACMLRVQPIALRRWSRYARGCIGALEPSPLTLARGLKLRHDHGSNYMSGDFQDETNAWGSKLRPPSCENPRAMASQSASSEP